MKSNGQCEIPHCEKNAEGYVTMCNKPFIHVCSFHLPIIRQRLRDLREGITPRTQ